MSSWHLILSYSFPAASFPSPMQPTFTRAVCGYEWPMGANCSGTDNFTAWICFYITFPHGILANKLRRISHNHTSNVLVCCRLFPGHSSRAGNPCGVL
ncbi:uncharacterized protein F4817DRAFT_212563 [Daldinia loculata]|uniref:uncharacterized protein n=1 Tax=Daldinia loculata TaxID=103429 RepID=UPI0020C4D492|nr:uncharacterized protein F4817DRAFT_212563 [Daldinia loculata]KAI1650890.1 hypothetical protein F4817DRAFT_212563 [Daldinia loculata]